MPSPGLSRLRGAATLALVSLLPATMRPLPASNTPPNPPNGTYVYDLARNGASQGKTTVTVYRRDERAVLETTENGTLAAASLASSASFRYAGLELETEVATYRAPFLRNSPLGRVDASRRTRIGFSEPVTVRYDDVDGALRATVDGATSRYLGDPLRATRLLDAPFMTDVLLAPQYLRRNHLKALQWTSYAFADGRALPGTLARPSVAPRSPRTPKNAVGLAVGGVGTIWYDPGNGIVYEAHFDQMNLDATLSTYSREVAVAQADTGASVQSLPAMNARATTVPGTDVPLSAVFDEASSGTADQKPVVVFVPPAPAGSRNYDDSGPEPMYVDLARAFTAAGFTVLRYDNRGVGKSGGSVTQTTWENAREDAEDVVRFVQSDASLDASQVYLLGYGNAADIALAASTSPDIDPSIAGVIALAPTVVRYRDCAKRTGGDVAHPDVWERSAFAHDPARLAQTTQVPVFVLHPGVPTCGETGDEVANYDDGLRSANPNATIVVAADLAQRFGGRYDADSVVDTQEFFPYRFDTSTTSALGEWLAGPKTHLGSAHPIPPALPGTRRRPPPPPPGAPAPTEQPLPRTTPSPVQTVLPGQLVVPTLPPTVPTPVPTR